MNNILIFLLGVLVGIAVSYFPFYKFRPKENPPEQESKEGPGSCFSSLLLLFFNFLSS